MTTTLLYAVLVLGVIAIVFGLILAFAAKIFEVETDPRLPEIQTRLRAQTAAAAAIPAAPAVPKPSSPARRR